MTNDPNEHYDPPVWRIERYDPNTKRWTPTGMCDPKWEGGAVPLMTVDRAMKQFVDAKIFWPLIKQDAHLFRLYNTRTKDTIGGGVLL